MTFDATANLHYAFDQENRITGANGYGYIYDGDGNRVEKVMPPTNPTGGTLYWYMTPGIVAETDLAGTTTSEYVFFGGERVARRDGVNGAGGVFYYFSDHLKTASVVTDAAGNIKAESDYYPWGGELQFTNNDSNHYKFTGKERDVETGLDYFGARYHSNALGRFATPDWAAKATAVPYAQFSDPQSLNLYSYVRNIPTSLNDPDGHSWFTDQLKKAGTGVLKALGVMATAPAPIGPKVETQTHTTGERVEEQVKKLQKEIMPFEVLQPHGVTETVAFGITIAAALATDSEEEISVVGGLLERGLASQAQVAELVSGKGVVIAGDATTKALRDAPRLAAEYGGAPADWVKLSSSHYTPSGSAGAQTGFATHAYQNVKTGEIVEMKTVPDQIHNRR